MKGGEPLIIVGRREDPRAAIKAEVTAEQFGELEVLYPMMIGPRDDDALDRWVPIYTHGFWPRQDGIRHPIGKENIVAYSDNFRLWNGVDENPIFKPIEEILAVIDGNPLHKCAIVGKDVEWKSAEDLEVRVSVGERNAHIVYASPVGTLLEVDCQKGGLTGVLGYVVSDLTGRYISPSEAALETQVQRVRDVAKSHALDGFAHRFMIGKDWGPGCRRYQEALEAAKTLASRSGGSVDEGEFQRIYRETWNSKLEKDMPEILSGMNRGLSLELAGRAVSWQFAESPDKQIEVIIDLANQDLINMSADSYLALGRAIVLNQRYLAQKEDDKVSAAQREARDLGREVADLSRRRDDILGGLIPLREKAGVAKDKLVRERNTLLWRLNLPDENGFASGVEPDDVTEEIEEYSCHDNIPF